MTQHAVFHTTFTGGVPGGPCPVCHTVGDLLVHSGSYGPGGQRTIVHTDLQGDVRVCSIAIDAGRLHSGPNPTWRYEYAESVDPS